ncbi:MAG: flippase [Elusimicrobia bacterium]|nr:flippase [Elusimicrobiota bacterium]
MNSLRQSKAFRFAKNVSWNLLAQVAIMAISFFTVPYLVHHMGTESYGLYLLLQAVTGYLLILIFGAGSATVRFVSEFAAAGDGRSLKAAVRYSLGIHLAGVVVGAVILFGGVNFFVERFFEIPGTLREAGVWVLRCAAVASVFGALIGFASAILQGIQRFDYQNLVVFLQGSLMPIGTAILLGLGLGLIGAASWYVVLNAAVCGVALWLTWTQISPRLSDSVESGKIGLRRFGVYGLSLWVGLLAWNITFQLDKLFIGTKLSLSELTLYAVPAGILQRLNVVPASVSSVLFPMMSELQGMSARENLVRMYLKSLRVLLWMILPVLILLFALMPQFLTLWLGAEFGGRSVWPARLLVIAQMFLLLNHVPNMVSASQDRPWYLSGLSWAQATISLVAWWSLIPHYQILGVAAGSLLAQMLPGPIYLHFVHKRLMDLSWERYLSEGLYAPCVSGALLLAVIFPLHAWADNWFRLGALVSLGVPLYYGSTWFLLGTEDRNLLRSFLELLRQPRRT